MSSMSEGIVSGIKIGGVICLIGGGLATLARMKNKVVFKQKKLIVMGNHNFAKFRGGTDLASGLWPGLGGAREA